jgi:hypothetical protein
MPQPRSAAEPSSVPPSSPTPSLDTSSPEPTSPLFSSSRSTTSPTSPTPPPSYDSPSDPSDELDDDFGSPDLSTADQALTAHGWRKRANELLPTTQAAVMTFGGIAHEYLTVDGTIERQEGLYLPDEDDVDAIATPLSGLAARRVPADAANPDIADLIGLLIGVGGYVVKQLRRRRELRAVRVQLPDDEQPQQ